MAIKGDMSVKRAAATNSVKNNKRNNRRINKTKKNAVAVYKVKPLKTIFDEKNLCCAIRFYDNQPDIIEQFQRAKKYVQAIQVSNSPNRDILRGNPDASLYTQQFLRIFPENRYAQYLSRMKNKEIQTNIGFSERDAQNLMIWASNSNIKTKVAIFDWDGTLSVIEGIILPPTKEVKNELKVLHITDYEIAAYYAGSVKRLIWLSNMFDFLHKKNVVIFILTNNPIAASHWKKMNDPGIGPLSRPSFYKVVKQFIPQIKEKNILCGFETDYFKPDTFSNNDYLREVYSRIQHWHFLHDSSSDSKSVNSV